MRCREERGRYKGMAHLGLRSSASYQQQTTGEDWLCDASLLLSFLLPRIFLPSTAESTLFHFIVYPCYFPCFFHIFFIRKKNRSEHNTYQKYFTRTFIRTGTYNAHTVHEGCVPNPIRCYCKSISRHQSVHDQWENQGDHQWWVSSTHNFPNLPLLSRIIHLLHIISLSMIVVFFLSCLYYLLYWNSYPLV